jgi:hypothetical protein
MVIIALSIDSLYANLRQHIVIALNGGLLTTEVEAITDDGPGRNGDQRRNRVFD